jgi:hypothetical protein
MARSKRRTVVKRKAPARNKGGKGKRNTKRARPGGG